MECVHCKKSVPKDTFDAHCREHAEIQTRLKRPMGRTYGARYEPKDPGSHIPPSEDPGVQTQNSGSPVPSNAGSSVRLNEETLPSHQSALDELDKRIHSIIESFPPYDGDGVEAPWPETADFACKDCSFKFRTKKECDEHYLSKYCRGAAVVSYWLTVDKSQPRGYLVEKKILPMDGITGPTLFQCRKCSSMFPTELEMENHQKTHLVLPSRCLHCQKMFSTKYELDDHYDWHDDMHYRQKVDGLGINDKNHETGELDGPKHSFDENFLASYTEYMSLHSPADNGKNQAIPEYQEVNGVSFISAEDIEQAVAPNGYYQGRSNRTLHVTPWGKVVRETLNTTPPGPARNIWLLGHGLPGYMLIVDVAGRKRWVKDFRFLGGRFRDHEPVDTRLDAADGQEERGERRQAMNLWIEALGMVQDFDCDDCEQRKFIMLFKVAILAQELNLFEVGVEYSLRALELCVKQFNKDSINNFQVINNLGVLFDKHGMFEEAAYLYRRSLLGRMKLAGPDHEDTLMTMQELANVNTRLGNIDAARLLLEQSYIGHANLQEPNKRATMGILSNLATAYSTLGQRHHAVALLESAIPQMRHSFGLGDDLTCGATRNLLTYVQKGTLASGVRDVIRDMQEDMTDPGSITIKCYADYLTRQRRLLEAEGVYRKAYDWRVARFGDSDSEAMECLYALAVCLDALQKIPQAEEAYQQLARLTAHSPENQHLHQAYIQAVAQLSASKDRLQAELRSWALEKPGRCACGKDTMRLCSSCQMKHSCPSDCQQANEEHNHCYPSVTPEQSISTIRQPMPADELEDRFRGMFLRDREIVGVPKLVSSEAIFFDPACFATIRVWKDPTKLVAYYFAKKDTRIAFGNMGAVDWQSSRRMGMTYLYPGTRADPVYLLVAPGETMFRSAKSEWLRMRGTGANAEIDLPNSAMIEYLQSKGPRAVEMELAVIMMVWECTLR
ncbi:hypothetical protein EDB80DRAFT_900317 [Ilyonectria destructans]|nr:hypothetical protein EDB80DRAFT_900317 [Ilyonectria destructans]